MIYLKKFRNNNERYKYIQSKFISPHVFYNKNDKNLKYLTKYRRLEYLSSTKTGAQYIDLGCHLMENTDDIRIDIKFNIKDRGYNSANQQGALVCSQTEINPYPGFVLRYQNATSDRKIQLQTKWNFTGCYFTSGKGTSKYLTYNNNVKFDNNIYEFSELLDNIPSSQINDCTCTLFCALDSSNNPFRYVEADLYYLKFTKGNNVVRNLIPVERTYDNAVGLYDIENDHLYTSLSNNSFVPTYITYWYVGREYPKNPLQYPEYITNMYSGEESGLWKGINEGWHIIPDVVKVKSNNQHIYEAYSEYDSTYAYSTYWNDDTDYYVVVPHGARFSDSNDFINLSSNKISEMKIDNQRYDVYKFFGMEFNLYIYP